MKLKLLFGILLSFGLSNTLKADITFNVQFTANALANLSAAEQALFTDGLDFWDNIIVDHQDLQSRNWTLEVNTINEAAMGGSVLLGSAGPDGLLFTDVVAGASTDDGRFIIANGGFAEFNIHPDAGSLSLDTIKHEIGHALGIGTLWEDNQVYNDGINGNSNRILAGGTPGEYVGANGLAAWQNEFVGQGAATFVPVELGGGPGTTHGHWNENENGAGLVGIVDANGNDMRDELMTGWASPNPDFLSQTSIQSLVDIGFVVNAVPEPGSAILFSAGALVFLSRRRRFA